MSIYVFLDSDKSKIAQIDNFNDVKDLEELLKSCKRKFYLPNMNEKEYGFKAMLGQTLLKDIDQYKAEREELNKSMSDQPGDFADIEESDILVCRNLVEEAKETMIQLTNLLNEVRLSTVEEDEMPMGFEAPSFDPTEHLSSVELIAQNFAAENEVFIHNFIDLEGISYLMRLIKECQQID